MVTGDPTTLKLLMGGGDCLPSTDPFAPLPAYKDTGKRGRGEIKPNYFHYFYTLLFNYYVIQKH